MGSQVTCLTMKAFIFSIVLLVLGEVSFQAHPPPSYSYQKAPEPVCRKVPKEVCEHVPKTIYDVVIRRECHDEHDTICSDVKERKCHITQKPFQDSVSRKQCVWKYKKDCHHANDIEKHCRQEYKEECHNIPEWKCVTVPRTVEETIHEEECSTSTMTIAPPGMSRIAPL